MFPVDPAMPTAARAAAAAAEPPMPSIGRMVLYMPTQEERGGRGGAEYYPAVITRVWSRHCVNLHVLADAGPAFPVTSATLCLAPADRSWCWPPRA